MDSGASKRINGSILHGVSVSQILIYVTKYLDEPKSFFLQRHTRRWGNVVIIQIYIRPGIGTNTVTPVSDWINHNTETFSPQIQLPAHCIGYTIYTPSPYVFPRRTDLQVRHRDLRDRRSPGYLPHPYICTGVLIPVSVLRFGLGQAREISSEERKVHD